MIIKDIGDQFQAQTKYTPESLGGHTLDWHGRPEPYKHYEHPLRIVPLPKPDLSEVPSLWKVLMSRRSRRGYDTERSLGIEHLSSLLWATQGITAEYGETLFRTAPSAGALYPVETYIFANQVETLEKGIYHFRPREFDLEFIRKEDLAKDLAFGALGQNMVLQAHVTFLWSAMVERAKWKYRQRAYRYIYLDAGHIAENLYLAGEALGLGVCAIGALFDDPVNDILGIDGEEETIIYMSTAGLIKP